MIIGVLYYNYNGRLYFLTYAYRWAKAKEEEEEEEEDSA